MEMQNVYHGHLIVSRLDETGWTHEIFLLVEAVRDSHKWTWKSIGESAGKFAVLAEAIKEAKRRKPPEKLPVVERVTLIEETEK